MMIPVMEDTEPVVEKLGSKGLIKRSELIRIITEALISLGFDHVGALLEQTSGIPLHTPLAKQFLERVKNGEWDECIDTFQGLGPCDEKAVKFLLLQQKFFDFLKIGDFTEAADTLCNQIKPLDVDMKQAMEFASKLISPSGKDTGSENSRSEVLEKLRKLFPPAVLVPGRRLEYLLEETLHLQLNYCDYHNHQDPIDSLSLFSDHCTDHEIPSVTVQTLEEHTDEVWFLKFSHNGKYLASSSKDKSAIIWEINAEGKLVQKHKLEGHEKPVVAVLWSPDDGQVITCGEDENIRLWDVETGESVRSFDKDGVRSVSCGWFPDGSGIIGGMTDRRICLWNLDGTELEHKQGQRAQRLSDVAMTSDGKWLVSVGKECEISLFDRKTGAETLIQERDMITSFTLSQDNKHLLTSLVSQKMCLWNIEGQPSKVFEFSGHKRKRFIIRSCFGGCKESFIAGGSDDSQVYIWHWSKKEWKGLSKVLPGHEGAVNCVSWNPTDTHMLASASDDGTIRIWGSEKKLK